MVDHSENQTKDIPYTPPDPCVLDDNAANLLIVNVKQLDPREDLHDMAHSSKGVVAKVHYLRNAHKTNGKPLTVDNAKVLLHWKAFFKYKAIHLAYELRDSEPCSGRLYSLAA